MSKERIGIIFGGRSGEHEVSLMSAASVISAIDREKYEVVCFGITEQGTWLLYDGSAEKIEDGSWQQDAEDALQRDPQKYAVTLLGTGDQSVKSRIDFAFPVLHGTYGEDGTVQGLFEMMDIPYAGCGVLSSAVCMDKGIAKDVFTRAGLPQVEHCLIAGEDMVSDLKSVIQGIMDKMSFPLFVKPANTGSSVGIGKATDEKQLQSALEYAARFDRRIVVERFIPCREVETGVVGNFQTEVAVVGEILAEEAEFYDYKAKYHSDGKTKLCIPAQLPEEQSEQIRAMAKRAYSAADCSGYARVDFFIDRVTGEIYLNEINTIPGFTKYSMFPILWEAKGLAYPQLIERIIALGYERHFAKNHR